MAPTTTVKTITKTATSTKKPYARTVTEALPDSTLTFPTGLARASFRLRSGKKVTQHQWKVSLVH